MSGVAGKAAGKRGRAAGDLRSVAVAVLLLAICGGLWVWMSADASARREKVLASVPAFPARGQDQARRRASAPHTPQPPPPVPRPQPAPNPAPPAKADPITSFVLKPAHDVALVHVNALLNTPLFARIKECLPAGWNEVTQSMAGLGIDVERDVDRLAVIGDGMALSGFFEDKPIARNIASLWPEVAKRTYRGQQLWISRDTGIAQVGNLLVLGPSSSMDTLLDRALDPAPPGADPQDIYGDVFMRSDLSTLRDRDGLDGATARPDAMRAIVDGLSGITVRANVWDLVAVSLEGKPQAGHRVADLAGMARGAISLAKEQLDPSDVELATLAGLAKVTSSKDALNIDLALPVNDLFDKLHFPCPGPETRPPRVLGPDVPSAAR
jgi:hypothetical protein